MVNKSPKFSFTKITRHGVVVELPFNFVLFEEVKIFLSWSNLKLMTPNSGATSKSDSKMDRYDFSEHSTTRGVYNSGCSSRAAISLIVIGPIGRRSFAEE